MNYYSSEQHFIKIVLQMCTEQANIAKHTEFLMFLKNETALTMNILSAICFSCFSIFSHFKYITKTFIY